MSGCKVTMKIGRSKCNKLNRVFIERVWWVMGWFLKINAQKSFIFLSDWMFEHSDGLFTFRMASFSCQLTFLTFLFCWILRNPSKVSSNPQQRSKWQVSLPARWVGLARLLPNPKGKNFHVKQAFQYPSSYTPYPQVWLQPSALKVTSCIVEVCLLFIISVELRIELRVDSTFQAQFYCHQTLSPKRCSIVTRSPSLSQTYCQYTW